MANNNRTHRERKEFYIKNLEAEVVTLREKDAAHKQVVVGINRKINDLKQILITNGIPLPSGWLHIEGPQANIALQTQVDGVQSLRATMPTLTTAETQNSEISDLVGTYDKMRFASGNQVSSQQTPGPAKSGSRAHPYDLDAAQIAVDFVLDLEKPCLSHHGPEVHDGEFSGHKLMVQTPIMAHSSTPQHVFNMKPRGELPNDATWTVPAVEVDRLLNLSSRLSLEGEITPIEAWQKIKQHPGFATLDKQRLEQLKTILLPEVQCYGYVRSYRSLLLQLTNKLDLVP